MVVCVTAVADGAIGIFVGESVDALGTVLFKAGSAFLAVWLQTGCVLRSNSNAVADFDGLLHLRSHTDSLADDFVPNADG